MKPNAGALLSRQRAHETRYFDSGDAFSQKAAGAKPQQRPEEMAHLVVVQGQDDSTKEEDAIARKNAEAEATFKKKFGNMKPNAGALLSRQRAHETRYFDSGDAFSQKAAGAKPQQRPEEMAHLVVVQGQDDSTKEEDAIARKNAEAEATFKKKFGNMKPNAGALLSRQRAHETRYFDSGDAFSQKAAGAKPQQRPEEMAHLVVVQGQDDSTKEVDAIARKNAEAEATFKKKFGNMKPNAGALLSRQRAHETRYFDSGDAFSQKAAGAKPQQRPEEMAHLVVVQGQDDSTKEEDAIARKNAEAEATFKKKFGNMKPNAGGAAEPAAGARDAVL